MFSIHIFSVFPSYSSIFVHILAALLPKHDFRGPVRLLYAGQEGAGLFDDVEPSVNESIIHTAGTGMSKDHSLTVRG